MRTRAQRIQDRASFLTKPYEEPAVMLTHAISELCYSIDDVGERIAEAHERNAQGDRPIERRHRQAVEGGRARMKAEQRTLYIARDGEEFKTAAKCLAHERATCGAALVGLTEAQVEAARTWATLSWPRRSKFSALNCARRVRRRAPSSDARGRTGRSRVEAIGVEEGR